MHQPMPGARQELTGPPSGSCGRKTGDTREPRIGANISGGSPLPVPPQLLCPRQRVPAPAQLGAKQTHGTHYFTASNGPHEDPRPKQQVLRTRPGDTPCGHALWGTRSFSCLQHSGLFLVCRDQN